MGLACTATAAAALTGAAGVPAAQATGRTDAHADSRAAARAADPPPTNAGKVFGWGDSQWHDGFVEPVTGDWALSDRGQIRNQHGMLTLDSTSGPTDVVAVLGDHDRQYGRWETRVRAEQMSTGHSRYRVVAELIPAVKAHYHCGDRNIVLAQYRLGTGTATSSIRNGSQQFVAHKSLDLGAGVFHTFAVEITPTHVSWFVDTHVLMTENRPAALSGATFKMRFRLRAEDGRRMNPSRMQMDWLRYYTLDRPNKKSIAAPRADQQPFTTGC